MCIRDSTSATHLNKFYDTFDDLKSNKYDGLIITGAPVEQIPFEEVDYWKELCEIMEWSKTHVHSTFHICWGAQAGLYLSLIHILQDTFWVGQKCRPFLFKVYPENSKRTRRECPVLLRQ